MPDLPGCFSAADEGIDRAIENAKEAIALWIEDSISNGESIPKPRLVIPAPAFRNRRRIRATLQ